MKITLKIAEKKYALRQNKVLKPYTFRNVKKKPCSGWKKKLLKKSINIQKLQEIKFIAMELNIVN